MKNNMTQEQKESMINHLKWLLNVSREDGYEMYSAGINFCIGAMTAWMCDCDKEEMKKINEIINEEAA